MDERRKPYPFDEFEPKWQAIWEERQPFHAPNPGEKGFDPSKSKFYVLDMFPYPSGAGLHVGHPEGYTATDIIARYKRLRGFNVLHPMGWDAFGLPAEQYAIKSGQHPAITTRENVAKFKNQLKRIGFSYDWQREINTTDPRYYKWTQWIFLQIYNSWFNPATNKAEPISTYSGKNADEVRLAYVADVPVNWCPELGTVLANEEVVAGKSEIGGFPVVRRPMRQWMLRITAYAERLLNELDKLDWPEGIKLLQRNWIGKSEGAEIDFKIDKGDQKLRVFATRPDTLYGGTFLVLAPEHSLVDQIVTEEQWPAVREYREKTARKSDLERAELTKEKTGIFTGAYAINPATEQKIPIWIADYVLLGYGTGAIGGVPAHDERDLEFARKFDLPIVEVVQPPGDEPALGFVGEGVAINSPVINGLPTGEAKKKITAWLEERGQGKGAINYKLRDWLFSRQRYWGEPFPVIWRNGNHEALPESELPLEPPALEDFKPTGTGEPPLAKAKDWIRYSESATRETSAMPQWAGSCWYYLRLCDPQNSKRFVGQEAERFWMGGEKPGGVDLYVGGVEHAVLHLLYARFWHKVLYDLGHISSFEPFRRLFNQGYIQAYAYRDERGAVVPAEEVSEVDGQYFWDGRPVVREYGKMGKSLRNVVTPDEMCAQYGADTFRVYEMSMGPLEVSRPWETRAVVGAQRFLQRVWRAVVDEQTGAVRVVDTPADEETRRLLHRVIDGVRADMEGVRFNTAIAKLIELTNRVTAAGGDGTPREVAEPLVLMMSPFAPHVGEELWRRLGPGETLAYVDFPVADPALLVAESVTYPVQVNGKVRGRVQVAADATEEAVRAAALAAVAEHMTGGARKVVVVPGRMVSVVV